MRLPLDTNRLQFLVVSDPEQLRKFEEGKPRESQAPRVDGNGEVLWGLKVVLLGDGEAEVVKLAVPGEPGVTPGEMVHVDELTAQPWENDGRWGISYRATAIRSLTGGAETAAA